MGRQLRTPLTMAYEVDAPLWYRPTPLKPPESARFVVQAGQNTAVILRGENDMPTLAHQDQLRPVPVTPDETPGNAKGADHRCDEPAMNAGTTPSKEPLRVSQRVNKGVPPVRYSPN